MHLNASLRRKQVESALQHGNTTMLIWLGKQRLGQRNEPAPESQSSQVHEFVLEMRKRHAHIERIERAKERSVASVVIV